MTGGLEGNIGK